MAGLSQSNSTSDNDNAITEIADGEGTGNRAEVTANKELRAITNDNSSVRINPGIFTNSFVNTAVWDDMNSTTGGVNRETSIGTTFQNVYSYSGNGYFFGFNLTLQDFNDWFIKVLVDGVNVFFPPNGLDTDDLILTGDYDIEDISPGNILGIGHHDDTIRFSPQFPIYYSSSLTIQVRRRALSKNFEGGFVLITKE